MDKARIAVIGGSGLYRMKGLEGLEERRVETPFGDPSDAVMLGTAAGVRCAFLPRHGAHHDFPPHAIPARANLWALKSLGAEIVLSFSAVGSLREELAPGHFVFPDQLVDETKGRRSTFFGDGIVAHVSFAHPFCPEVSARLLQAAQALGIRSHAGGTLACMEGPAFSTRAESLLHRRLGYSIIGMTAIPEAKLTTQGDLLFRGVTTSERIPLGSLGQVLRAGLVNPQWQNNTYVGTLAGRPLPDATYSGSFYWGTNTLTLYVCYYNGTTWVWSALGAGARGSTTVRVANVGLVGVFVMGRFKGSVCNSARCTSNTASVRDSQVFMAPACAGSGGPDSCQL